MKIITTLSLCIAVCVISVFGFIGYALVSDSLFVEGEATYQPKLPDLYISDVTPGASAGVTITETYETLMFMKVDGAGTANFTVEITNSSLKTYVYERVVDGKEANIEGVYSGDSIDYQVGGVASLDEIAPGQTLSFNVRITVPAGVSTVCYILKFNFIEKTGTEILPGQDEYNITFKYNNGRPDHVVRAHINEFIARPEIPTKPQHVFLGWYTDESCTVPWNFDTDRVQGEMVLYAGWQFVVTEYKVTCIPNNGDPIYTLTVSSNELLTVPQTPTREGYSFIGWYTDANCTIPWNFDTDRVNSNMTLYGGWEIYVPPVPPELNITFVPNNGEESTIIIVMTGEFIPRPEVPVREGYRFVTWYTDAECTLPWNFEVDRPSYHMTLYGGWTEIIKYTVTFKPNNGTADSYVTVDEGQTVPPPATPVREGYVFIGWYTDEECTVPWNLDIDIPRSNLTLYGGWEKMVENPDEYHADFTGLVEALLSDSNNCLNDSNVIFNAVISSLNSSKRPNGDAPIVHCDVKSVSGGTMSAIASYANSKLTKNLEFIFVADEDPAYENSRMCIYMYYSEAIDSASNSAKILVYKQVVTRRADGVWIADGTYVGYAEVGNYFGGGNNGADVRTINPYSWKAGEIPIDE